MRHPFRLLFGPVGLTRAGDDTAEAQSYRVASPAILPWKSYMSLSLSQSSCDRAAKRVGAVLELDAGGVAEHSCYPAEKDQLRPDNDSCGAGVDDLAPAV